MTADEADALATEQAMRDTLAADLAAREAATGAPNWRGRALLLAIEGRIAELQAAPIHCNQRAAGQRCDAHSTARQKDIK